MWPFSEIKYLKQRIRDAEQLVGALDSFIFVARTDGRKSAAVDFAAMEVQMYKDKYNWRNDD